jgi:uncharacterized protein YgiM (DUF1202 family)
MKMNLTSWPLVLTFVASLAAPACADQKTGTNVPPILTVPPPVVVNQNGDIAAFGPEAKGIAPAKAKPAAKKKITAKKTAKAKPSKKIIAPGGFSLPLTPGPATVAASRVNVRGKPTIRSEVVGHLTNGQPVTVIEEIKRDNARQDDPSIWAKIVLPGDKHLWVAEQHVDMLNKLVHVKKLNVRSGPGENFSIVGQLEKGDSITDLGATNGWLEIAPPTNAYAYVAAAYLKQDFTAPSATVTTPTTTTTVTETTPVAEAPTTAPALIPIPITSLESNKPAATATTTSAVTPAVEAPVEPRIVQREGVVRRTFSIQSPSSFQLVSPDTGKTINYLYTSAKNLDLARYKGLHIIVTGEESLDERWQDTPVITIQKIQVVE